MSNFNQDYTIKQAINEVLNTYGDTISVDAKAKRLLKIGRNNDIDNGVFETVWQLGGIETYPTTNAIDTVVSTSASDTQEIIIEWHTIDGSGNFTYIEQTATLTGTTPVPLSTPLARSTRCYNNNGTNLLGTVTVYESVGTVNHLSMNGTTNQSLKCSTTIEQSNYYIITAVTGSVLSGSGSGTVVDFRLKFREKGKVFRTIFPYVSSYGQNTFVKEFSVPIIIPPNSDLRIDAAPNSNNAVIEASFNGYLAQIV